MVRVPYLNGLTCDIHLNLKKVKDIVCTQYLCELDFADKIKK